MKKYTVLVLIALVVVGAGVFYRYHGRDIDERGATLLMRSLEERADLKVTHKLIKRAADLNTRDKTGRTALFYAARYAQNAKAVQQLLAAGADVNLADKQGCTALMRAAKYNPSAAVTEELISGGAYVNVANAQGETALTLAAQNNTAAVLKMLLRAGADPDIKTAGGVTAADLLDGNEKLSEREKTDYRQAMLVVSILRPAGK
ncbi:MAG: ankyrin repeat domain-containing protein [Candidatus Avelusimicrobium sp.]|uniref:ankyrin repeat domain-containing protein n=1 Tax=Candidatus Avelusimicrobium sp. TaxID=3048833 RepID=UPI003F0D367A